MTLMAEANPQSGHWVRRACPVTWPKLGYEKDFTVLICPLLTGSSSIRINSNLINNLSQQKYRQFSDIATAFLKRHKADASVCIHKNIRYLGIAILSKSSELNKSQLWWTMLKTKKIIKQNKCKVLFQVQKNRHRCTELAPWFSRASAIIKNTLQIWSSELSKQVLPVTFNIK
jgi:hypothetical protein